MQSKEITIGGYLPGNSFLHKLDPRTKLIALGVLLGTVFAAPCSYKILLPTLSAILAVFLSQIGWRVWINGLRKFSLMLLITLVLNFTLNQEGVPIQFFGFITPFSYDGLTNAAFLTSKITLVIIFSLALTFTTLPWNIVKGLNFLIRPLRIIGVSTGDASLVLFLALRFVPLFQEEWLRLIEAQQSRGIELTSGALLIRSKRLMSLIIPSMLLAF
ncbi:MAG: energy-coupling factor transporter transmembrane component T family protein, partial [Desulfomonilaceae bacterium]